MRRIGMLLTVTMIVVGMLAASATGAIAAPKTFPPFPNPGTNSDQPLSNVLFPGHNFGHCQSRVAKEDDSANSAKEQNPAVLTGGEFQQGGSSMVCPKNPPEEE
jgi:hypothetical protein